MVACLLHQTAMSIACPRSQRWLHRTFRAWALVPRCRTNCTTTTTSQGCRKVSTTSAINRGLRASKMTPFPNHGGRSRASRNQSEKAKPRGTRERNIQLNNGRASEQKSPILGHSMSVCPSFPPQPSTSGPLVISKACLRLRDLLTTINASESFSEPPSADSLREAAALVSTLNEKWKAGTILEKTFIATVGENTKNGKLPRIHMHDGERARAVARSKTVLVRMSMDGGEKMDEWRLMGPSAACLEDLADVQKLDRQHGDGDGDDTSLGFSTPYFSRETKSISQRIERSNLPSQKPFPRDQRLQEDAHDSSIPISIPYTTAASTFLYGFNAVLAALKSQRRKLYHLYLHPRASSREDQNPGKETQTLTSLAKTLSIPTSTQPDIRLLDKISGGRPHNGVVLECGRLPTPPLLSLGKPDLKTNISPLSLDRQTAEDIAVHGSPAAIPTLTKTWRHPFVLMLDGITDPGNLGNILRTAHFYGVDAVAVATNTCAPLDSVAVKASSGACEAVRIFALPKPSAFVYESAKIGGWRVYAAAPPPPPSHADSSPPFAPVNNTAARRTTSAAIAVDSPLARYPCILMLGAEGEGLRANLVRRADALVSIERGAREAGMRDVGVESLNVGVAAGVLVDSFLKRPEGLKANGLGF